MPVQASHFLRLPVELRLIIYEHIFEDPKEITLYHSLTHVSDQVSEEVLPILLRRFSFFFWTAIPCEEEWYFALRPRSKVWRMRLTNVSEWPLQTVPTLHTRVSFHLLIGRHILTHSDLMERMLMNYPHQSLTPRRGFHLEKQDQQDGVKRLVEEPLYLSQRSDHTAIWFERGRAGAHETNKRLIERVWNQQWFGGGRRGPLNAWMCRLKLLHEPRHAARVKAT
jgi:hypothetical protein